MKKQAAPASDVLRCSLIRSKKEERRRWIRYRRGVWVLLCDGHIIPPPPLLHKPPSSSSSVSNIMLIAEVKTSFVLLAMLLLLRGFFATFDKSLLSFWRRPRRWIDDVCNACTCCAHFFFLILCCLLDLLCIMCVGGWKLLLCIGVSILQ